MNENNIENMDLDAVDVTGAGDGISNDSAPAAEAPADNVEAATETVVENTEAAPAPVTRKGAGRRVDTEGKTALGKARNIYAANPNLSVKELKQRFQSDIGVSAQVAQTYASLVRRDKSA